MNKIWIPIILFALIISGGLLYNEYVSARADEMLELADRAYSAAKTDFEECGKIISEIEQRLDKISGLLCAFLDRDIINDAQDVIASVKGYAAAKNSGCLPEVLEMKEKISHIKNSAQIKLKYIL